MLCPLTFSFKEFAFFLILQIKYFTELKSKGRYFMIYSLRMLANVCFYLYDRKFFQM